MPAITRKLIYVRLPMTFGTCIEVVDHNGLTTTFGDTLAYAAFAEGLARFAADGSDVTLVDADGKGADRLHRGSERRRSEGDRRNAGRRSRDL